MGRVHDTVKRPAGGVGVAGFMATLVLVVAGCSWLGSDTGSGHDGDGPDLTVDLEDGGFSLRWEPEARPDVEDFELAVLIRDRIDDDWIDDGDWAVRPVSGTSTSFTDVEEGRRYLFRVRQDGGAWSEIVERQYEEPTLPVIRLATDDGDPMLHGRGTYRQGTFSLDSGGVIPVEIRGRGNSTWRYVRHKKPFQIKFSRERPLLGMAPSKRWVLLANAFDRSSLRTHVAFDLAGVTDLEWTPTCEWVELVLNGDYYGLYQLCEKIDAAPDKVDVDRLGSQDTDGEEITGGYILELGSTPAGSKKYWNTALRDRRVAIYRPSVKDSNAEQFAYIRDHFDQVERALFSDDFDDPDEGFRAWIDVDALIDYWIVQELTLDDDGFRTSVYVHKKRGDDKLYFGPVWDFDKSMGSDFSRYAPDTEGWMTMHPKMLGSSSRGWIVRAFEDPTFVDQVARRWDELLPELEKVPDRMLEVAPGLEDAKARDLRRWADEVDSKWEFRYGDLEESDEPAFIAEWLKDRMAWITENLPSFDSKADPGPTLQLMPKTR